MTAPQGWSRAGARHYGKPYQPPAGGCYYCGVPDCTDCGEPPLMLTRTDIIRDPTDPDDDQDDQEDNQHG